MGRFEREKGARFERIVAELFRDNGFKGAFRSCQYCGKTGTAADVEGVYGLHIECKHHERMSLYEWMEQAVRDCEASPYNTRPVVIHKANNKPILVSMRFDDFIALYKDWFLVNKNEAWEAEDAQR